MSDNEKNLPETTAADEKATFDVKEAIKTKSEALEVIGQVQGMNFISKLADAAILKKLLWLKETKEYKGLMVLDDELGESGEWRQLATWEECCKFKLGMSRRTIDERLTNFKALGEELYGATQKIGLSVRDLNNLRLLDETDRQQVIESEAVEAGNKEELQDLIDELKDAHKKETSDLNHKNVELRNSVDIKSKMNDRLSTEMMQLKEELAKHDFKADNWQNTTKQALLEAISYEAAAMEALNKLSVYRQFIFESDDLTDTSRQYLAGGLLDASKQLAEDFALFWTDSSSMLAAYLPHIRPSIESLEELSAQALENGKG